MTPVIRPDDDLAFAASLADAARGVALEHFRTGLQAEAKPAAEFDPVTEADRAIEARLRALIAEAFPDDGVLGEEADARASASGRTWVIDPIDGTRSFIAGLPLWGTLIALNDGTRPVVGVMDQPYIGDMFLGWSGDGLSGGAELRHGGKTHKLKASGCRDLGQAILSSTDPAMFRDGAERGAFDTLCSRTRLRRYGADCYAYSLLAAGYIDLVVEAGLAPYDIQAPLAIVEGAGGVVTTWSGGDAQNGGQIVAAANAALHAQALETLRPGVSA